MDRLRILLGKFKNNIIQPFLTYLSTPVAKITIANSILFALWQSNDVSNTFLAKHFAFDRKNIQQHRLYTFLTYSFSHMAFWHFAISTVALNVLGLKILVKYGLRQFWTIWLCGALIGGIAMQYSMPYDSIPIPKVGSDSCISAFISFLTSTNPKKVAFNFIFPIRYWLILLCAIGFVITTDSTGKNLGGLAAGICLGLLRRSLI